MAITKDIKYLGDTGLSELVNLLQATFAKKQNWLQYDAMPDFAINTGKVVQYTGATDTYIKGHFYYSDGISWKHINVASPIEVVSELPTWAAADSTVVYFVVNMDDTAGTGYIKSTVPNKFYTLGGSSSFKVVTEKPKWSEADKNTIYFVPNGDGTLTGFIKDTDNLNEFFEIGSSKDVATIKKYPDSVNYDPNAVYDDTGVEVEFSNLEIAEFKDDEILKLFDEV